MPAPGSRQFCAFDTREARLERSIDNHYHLEMVAENSRQLIDYQASSLRLQHEAAISNLRNMDEISGRLNQTNSLLSLLAGGLDNLNNSLDALNASATDILNVLYAQTEILHVGFQRLAQLALHNQKLLTEIADTLSRPYETQASELLREADRALRTGMNSTGRDQRAEYADATRLLQAVLNNPIGSRNYVAWFQVGWLRWKNETNIAGAEEAFYQAARLSTSERDLYHANSLRHMAYMQYQQSNYLLAYESIQKALRVMPNDHDIRYDAARYAARAGREVEALDLLEKCIDQQPQTIVTMFTEEDFLR